MNRFGVIFIATMLAGCMSFDTLDAELPKYSGRHIDALVAKMGYPNSEQSIMGTTVYVWNTEMQHTSITPTTSTVTGYAGSTPITAYATSYNTHTSHLSCTIRVFVDGDNIIQHGDYSGNNGACFTYSNRLKPE